MKNLIVLARSADLNSTGEKMFNWKWNLSELKPADKNVKVFSTFSCGGGSTMGYKLAGFEVLGNVEIDSKINSMYVKNFSPKYNFNMDLRKFNQLEDIPAELFQLDILDGSPPCTTFSTAGLREKTWGKKKKFREGQTEQVLDDLFFTFLETAEKLQPKIIIAENVVGLIKDDAKGYVNLILKKFYSLGYEVQVFKLNAAFMNVPQARERIFFIANNQHYKKLNLNFDYPLITFGEVKTAHGKPIDENSLTAKRLKHLRPGDIDISHITRRLEGRRTNFNHMINFDDRISFTLPASGNIYRACDKSRLSDGDFINISTFPQDYDFCNQNVQFVCGMSVPPNMMANIATEIYNQWLKE